MFKILAAILFLCWLPAAQAANFSISDLTGTWDIYSLWDDTATSNPGWDKGSITFDSSANVTAGSYTDSTGATVTFTSGSANVSSLGYVSVSLQTDIPGPIVYSQFKMTDSKSYISGVRTQSGTGKVSKTIMVKHSSVAFNTADLDGTWIMYSFAEHPVNTFPFFRNALLYFQNGALAENYSVQLSNGQNTNVGPGSTATLSSDGQLNMALNLLNGENQSYTQHRMDSTRNIIAGVSTQPDGTHYLSIMVRRYMPASESYDKLEGAWELSIFSDNGANEPRWKNGVLEVDDRGNITGGSITGSDGVTSAVTGGNFTRQFLGKYLADFNTETDMYQASFSLSATEDVMAGSAYSQTNYHNIVTATKTVNTRTRSDIVVDFGGLGLWTYLNDSQWQKLNNSSPDNVITGDVDGNGLDDVIADFGSTLGGLFIKRNGGTWRKLHNSSSQSIATGDLDGNGMDDIVIDFGSIGLWARMNDSSWWKLNNSSPDQVVIADMDGNGADDVIADFGSSFGGVFVKRNGGAWAKLHNTSSVTMAAGDLDGNGNDDVIINFGAIGLWARMNNVSWLKLHNGSPDKVTAGDIDGNGADDLIASFTGSWPGIWLKLNLASWERPSNLVPDHLSVGDLDANGKSDLIAAFGSTLGGIYVRRNNVLWLKLHNSNPEDMATGDLDGS